MMEEKYEPLKLSKQLCFPLYACSREMIKLYKPWLDELGLTYTQYITMMVLWEHKAMTVKALGQELFLDSGTLTPLLKKLEEKGLVVRHRDRNDKRTVHISLTEKGQVAYHFHCSFLSAMAEAMQEGMSPGEREALQRGLEKLNHYFTEKE